VVAILFATPHLELIIPFGALGALLFYSGISLYRTATKTEDITFTALTGVIAFVFGMAWAFLIMLLAHNIQKRIKGVDSH